MGATSELRASRSGSSVSVSSLFAVFNRPNRQLTVVSYFLFFFFSRPVFRHFPAFIIMFPESWKRYKNESCQLSRSYSVIAVRGDPLMGLIHAMEFSIIICKQVNGILNVRDARLPDWYVYGVVTLVRWGSHLYPLARWFRGRILPGPLAPTRRPLRVRVLRRSSRLVGE